MPHNDSWDWPFLLYAGTVVLRRSEKEFWRMTPRKLNALVAVHAEVNNPEGSESGGAQRNQPQTGYIDQIF